MLHENFSNLFSNVWKEVLILGLTAVVVAYAFVQYKFTYWRRRGVHYAKPSFPFGCLTDFIFSKRHISETLLDIYNEAEGHPYVGFFSFWTPSLLIRDPNLLKNVLVKDFDVFVDRGVFLSKDDPLANHLFSMSGNKWKITREKLTPTFGAGKVKQMYQIMNLCALQLENYLTENIGQRQEMILDIKELVARHSINVIANSAVGIEGHSLKDESAFTEIALKATKPSVIQGFRFILSMLTKDVAKLFNLRFTPKEVENCYLDLTKTIVEHRSKDSNKRNDFMQLLLDMWDKDVTFEYRPESGNDTALTLRDVAAQTFVFVLAAYESTASVLCFTLYEMAKHPEIQQKLIAEIDAAGSMEDMTYEKLLDLKYMDMVLNEVWRIYPPLGFLQRECQRDYKLPDGKIIDKGTLVVLSTYGLHMNPEYFPEPGKFDPERFNKENPSHVIQPFTYMPFGEGPRFCIGKRFGIINSKITLVSLLSKFRFELTEKSAGPIKIDPKVFATQNEGGMYLKAILRI